MKLILFLPYKASMWDSLESIWRAAENDPECEAAVVPVPYFVNSRASGRQFFCDSGLFPKYVKITDYRKFNLAKAKPHAIYIHNCYDSGNSVIEIQQTKPPRMHLREGKGLPTVSQKYHIFPRFTQKITKKHTETKKMSQTAKKSIFTSIMPSSVFVIINRTLQGKAAELEYTPI